MNPLSKGEETIFAEALRLPLQERAAYVAQATAGNSELRQEVESLLQSYGLRSNVAHTKCNQTRE